MYSECVSLADSVLSQSSSEENVLRSFPPTVGREVVGPVIRSLQDLVLGKSYGDAAPLSLPEHVQWVMQTVGYGLTLPLADLLLLQGCVDVYQDWLSSLYFKKLTVPPPILQDPNHYAQIIFSQLSSLFVPREGESRSLEDHAFLCKKVIDYVRSLMVVKGLKMNRETWASLFSFLLQVCDQLLSPPSQSPSLGTSLCEPLIRVLFSAWLRACRDDTFPNPNLWKTLREFCSRWRHHLYLMKEWSKVMHCLTTHLVSCLYGNKHLTLLRLHTPSSSSSQSSAHSSTSDFSPLIKELDYSRTVQTWFRFLHSLGNPVDLLHQEVIIGTPSFRRALRGSSAGASPLTPVLQSCIDLLPLIFEEAMDGLSKQVNLFIGYNALLASDLAAAAGPPGGGKGAKVSLSSSVTAKPAGSGGFRSPSVRRKEASSGLSKSTFYTPSPVQTPLNRGGERGGSEPFYINLSPDPSSPPFPGLEPVGMAGGGGVGGGASKKDEGIIGKPRGNSLLHIFGNWLFESASWTGKDRNGVSIIAQRSTSSAIDIQDSELVKMQQRIKSYEAGRAEAISCLCTIFSQMPCGEDVLHLYLSRFYHALSVCLSYDPQRCTGQVLTRAILGSVVLLRKDFIGFNLLVPQYLTSIERILPVDEIEFRCDADIGTLRKASIQILLSILPLPLHYIHLKIPDLVSLLDSVRTLHSLSDHTPNTFYTLKNRIVKIMFAAMETEKDPGNMQMLLHGFNILIHDILLYESSLSKMMQTREEGGEEREEQIEGITSTEKASNALSLNTLFQSVCHSAHVALQKWSNENIVTLAALDLLSDLARLQFDALSHVGCHDSVQWVCDFIETQSQQKPFLQTKSLHTSIVAGFTTLIVWIMEHPHLLAHESCMASLLRVTEFGITGTFSKSDAGVTLKGDKDLRPISGRVGEVAEFLLYCIMEKFGSFPSPCGPAASGSLLTEDELIKQLTSTNKKAAATTSTPKFRYFLIDNSLILGLLEGSFSEEEDALPTVTGIIRGPSSRQVWTIQLRHHPRSHTPSTLHLRSRPRPTPLNTPPSCPNLIRPPWPDEGKIKGLKLSGSIPKLDDIVDESSRALHREISQLTANQITVESNIQSQLKRLEDQVPFPNPARALEPPQIKKDLDTARLFLSHLGILNIEYLQGLPGKPSLSMLDSSSLSFRSALSSLDRMPTRYCDTVFVMYCSKGQTKPEEILRSQLPLRNKSSEYKQFLQGLGWIVDPFRHPGFTGKLRPEAPDEGGGGADGISSHGILSAQIPLRNFPYYADAITEIAFVTPTQYSSANESVSSVRSVESSDSGPDSNSAGSEPVLVPSLLASQPPLSSWSAPSGSGVSKSQVTAGEGGGVGGMARPIRSSASQSSSGTAHTSEPSDTPRRRVQPPRDCAVLVVWLEVFEDHLTFPIVPLGKLLYRAGGPHGKGEPSSPPVLFIHKMRSGLYQISAKTGSSPGGPLIDGVVVSSRCLSVLVRQTVINVCARHRMENEGYSPPHVKRKRKIEEMATHFGRRLTPAGLYTELLSTSSSTTTSNLSAIPSPSLES